MFKKSFVLGAGAVLLLALFFGRSHVLTTIGMVKQTVKDSVPIEFEIKRARQMLNDLEPAIEKNRRLLVQEEVQVNRFENDLVELENDLSRDRDQIVRLKDDLDEGLSSGQFVFTYANGKFTTKEVESELASRFDRFKTQAATLESQKQILAARQQGLEAGRDKLKSMLDAKRKLEVDIENLEARLTMVEVAQASSTFKFDDSQLSRTQELITDIGTRIEVAEKLVHADSRHQEQIQLDEPDADRDISEEVAKYFGDRQLEIEAFVKASRIQLDR